MLFELESTFVGFFRFVLKVLFTSQTGISKEEQKLKRLLTSQCVVQTIQCNFRLVAARCVVFRCQIVDVFLPVYSALVVVEVQF